MINISVFIGRLTTEPELRKTKTDVSCCNFQLAVQRKNTEQTDFPPMTAYGKLAEIMCAYVHKGDLICVSARYQSNVKNKKKYHEFRVDEIQFLEKKRTEDYEDIEIPGAADFNSSIDSNGDDDLPF